MADDVPEDGEGLEVVVEPGRRPGALRLTVVEHAEGDPT